ncbi:RNA-directed DNA polymerase, eukaryota, Reverse transcriptase zinc-binding domain protein [Artemisia annua]|uniref:RNA-directed DNA polymerase, eukaryota, Reverse transcriptase zinc-binding domain protein n=1 Tax=Artemisia annua TaxID=35608 RepID=A0A2U1MPU7_ARTAN|nr:RNA-directed DNA polymerase, eukaryota, Reverse transcriptase zinc-binding domain protein [Artemisia annua]
MDNIIWLFNVFYLASGLRINIHKSNVYGIRVSNIDIEGMARSTGCTTGSLPFTYLGLPIGSSMKRLIHWQSLIDKFESRLSRWKAKLLFICGRSTLVKTVLGSVAQKKVPNRSIEDEFVCICRFLSDILTRSSPPAPVYDDLWSLENHQLVDLFESYNKEDLFGSVVSKVEEVILLRFPYTLYRLKNGEKLEDVSLSIPGKEKRIETDETLTIILDDFETKDYKSGSCRPKWDRELNAVFISAQFEPKHSPEYPSPRIFKSIHSRINLVTTICTRPRTTLN